MRKRLIIIGIILIAAFSNKINGQIEELELVAENCSEDCPSYDLREIFEQYKSYFYQIFRESESGTINAHEEGGYIIQTREKQEDGCYLYCTKIYRGNSSSNCFFDVDLCYVNLAKPLENENLRVIASYHTHPITYFEDIHPFLEEGEFTDPTTQGVEFDGYQFKGLDLDQSRFSYMDGPSNEDKIVSVSEEVPGLIISGDGSDQNSYNAAIYGYTDYRFDENLNIVGAAGDLVSVPRNLAWECKGCVDIQPVTDCVETDEEITLHATVRGVENKEVKWEAEMGSFGENGVYTTPSTSGSYMVKAISVEDPDAVDSTILNVGNCSTNWKLTITGDYYYSDSSYVISHITNNFQGTIQINFSDAEDPGVNGIIRTGTPISPGFTGNTEGVFYFTNCGANLNDVPACNFTTSLGNSADLVGATLNIESYSEEKIKGSLTSSWQIVDPFTYPPETKDYEAVMEFSSELEKIK